MRWVGLLSAFSVALLAVSTAGGGDASAASSPPPITRRWVPAVRSRCDRPLPSPLAYGYPVRPFDRQHPIRGNFGDPRTLTSEATFGADTPRSPGSFDFHNGVDISAATGTAVYPVVSGVARIGYSDEVIVVTGDARTFQYFHIRPAVAPGQFVIAYRTVLGHVLPEWLHVHLSEIDGFRVHNPADPGHLEPYQDHTVPIVHKLFFSGASGQTLDPQNLRGRLLIAAEASDIPPLPVPAPWFGFPVTPALVTWKLTTANGRTVLPRRVVVDFRQTEPPNRDFWRVYAAGTYQNFPVFGRHYFFGRPGRYLFNLTPFPLDSTRLHNGAYLLTVQASDVCGNRGTLSEHIRIHN